MQEAPKKSQPEPVVERQQSGWWFEYEVFAGVAPLSQLLTTIRSVGTALSDDEVWQQAKKVAGDVPCYVVKHVIVSHVLKEPIEKK